MLGAAVLALLAGFLVWKSFQTRPVEWVNSIGMQFVKVPAGKFQMGSPEGETGRGKNEMQHEVEITRPFWLGVHEVTQAQYTNVMGVNPSVFTRAILEDGDQHPVENVSWDEAVEFCRRLTEREFGERSYRLPTEAEWEYACRAGSKGKAYAFGDSLLPTQANTLDAREKTKGRTTAVGSYKPNAWGLFDMHGNVWEWCSDWYDPNYYAISPDRNPHGPEPGSGKGLRKASRGGSWRHHVKVSRCSARSSIPPEFQYADYGFRVAGDICFQSSLQCKIE
jgi:formylglycine-generating enzyme